MNVLQFLRTWWLAVGITKSQLLASCSRAAVCKMRIRTHRSRLSSAQAQQVRESFSRHTHARARALSLTCDTHKSQHVNTATAPGLIPIIGPRTRHIRGSWLTVALRRIGGAIPGWRRSSRHRRGDTNRREAVAGSHARGRPRGCRRRHGAPGGRPLELPAAGGGRGFGHELCELGGVRGRHRRHGGARSRLLRGRREHSVEGVVLREEGELLLGALARGELCGRRRRCARGAHDPQLRKRRSCSGVVRARHRQEGRTGGRNWRLGQGTRGIVHGPLVNQKSIQRVSWWTWWSCRGVSLHHEVSGDTTVRGGPRRRLGGAA